MSLAGTLAAGRRSAERLMTSTCRITRLREDDLDDSTLNLTDLDPSDDLVYEGPCRVRSLVARVQTKDVEGQVLAMQQPILALPVATSGQVQVGDEAVILDGGDDPSLAGRRFRIRGLHSQTQSTAHRFPVEELDG